MAGSDTTLYSREFGSRPLFVLGGGIVLGALLAGAAISVGVPVLALVAVLPVAGGIAGFLTATTHLDVTVGNVTRRSRMKSVSYDASTLTVERRGTSNLFVLAPRDAQRKVLCTFPDEDPEHVREAFTAAGVEYVASESVSDTEQAPAS